MRVVCKKITSQDINLIEVNTVSSNNFDYNFGGYGLELDKEYLVMGIILYFSSQCSYYLIDVHGKPYWFPYLLFDILENSIPSSWFFINKRKNIEGNIHIICGFDELCNDEEYYNKLISREEKAMRTYFKRKIELEKAITDKDLMADM